MPICNNFVKICVGENALIKDFIKENWQILLIEILTILVFGIFYGKFGDITVDSYREAYIPLQMLQGNALYKDIFVIYPPLAYLINAFLLLASGANLNILFFTGLFTTICILFLIFRNACYFLNKNQAFCICLISFVALCCSSSVFNSFFPYSYGLLYGIFFTLLSVNFVLEKKYPLAYLFCSLAICSKIELALLLPVLFIFTRTHNLKYNLTALILPPTIISITLFLLGTDINSLQVTANLIDTISKTKTLYWFYSVMGLTFRWELIPIYILNLTKTLAPIILIMLIPILNKFTKFKTSATLIYSLLIILISFQLFSFGFNEIFIYAYPLITILLILRYKNLTSKERFFVIASIFVSIKVFFALTLHSYGAFFLPLALTSIFILIPEKFRKYVFYVILLWALAVGVQNINSLYKKDSKKIDKAVEFVKTQTKPNDTVVVYPEGLAINVLSERKSDNKFYSLIPLYVETFGEDIIINRLKRTKPNYIIISNYDTSLYYYSSFGLDYAQEVLKWIEKNYSLETIIQDGWAFKIYRKL